VLLLLAAEAGLSRLLRVPRVHRYLTARLEAAFGRPVEVSYFATSLLAGPRLEAHYVTVEEDPRFGYEYFLRAERLTAGLRWRSLARGRIEFGTLSITRPSLNLVRTPAGEWNLERWLPAPQPPGAAAPGSAANGRLYRIEIETGRINFKRGAEKHPFALVDVNGTVEQEEPGRWRLDVESNLMRAGVVVQEAGLLRVRGRIGGTQARLRPAELRIAWEDASLADLLRLVRGHDYGVRGRVLLEAQAESGTSGTARPAAAYAPWTFRATARLSEIHRWDLPPRPGDPALNLHLDLTWSPEKASIEVSRAEIEAPGSNLRATGFFTWADQPLPQGESKLRLRLTSAGIALDDLLAWYRAFRPGVSEQTKLEGTAGLNVQLSGWPLRIEHATLAANDAQFRAPGLSSPLLAGKALLRMEGDSLVLAPVTLRLAHGEVQVSPRAGRAGMTALLPPVPGLFRFEARVGPLPATRLEASLSGETQQVGPLLAAGAALGWSPVAAGWSVEGAASAKLRWQGSLVPFSAQAQGTAELRNLRVSGPLLAQPVQVQNARLELAPREPRHRLVVASARAFGARWSGMAERRDASQPWQFALTADRLETSEIARAFTPERPGLLARLAPGADSPAAALPFAAQGRVEIAQLWLRPLEFRRVQARVELDEKRPWRVRLPEAQADFYGGTLRGSFEAAGGAVPSFRFSGRFERLSVAALAASTPALAQRFTGTATGEVVLFAVGTGRDALLRSLEGSGRVEVHNGEVRGLDLFEWLRETTVPPATPRAATRFLTAAGTFFVGSRVIKLDAVRLTGAAEEVELSGTVDFSQALDLRVRELPRALASAEPSADAPGRAARITGTLAAPRVIPAEAPPAAPPARPPRARPARLN
jgi:hypothetical protein